MGITSIESAETPAMSQSRNVESARTPWRELLAALPVGAGLTVAGLAIGVSGLQADGLFPVWYSALFAGVAELVLMLVSVLAALGVDLLVKMLTGVVVFRGIAMGAVAGAVSAIGFGLLQGGTIRPAFEFLIVGGLNAAAVAVVGAVAISVSTRRSRRLKAPSTQREG